MSASTVGIGILSGTSAVALFRIFQLIDFYQFYNLKIPRNLALFIEILSQPTILEYVNNPFESLDSNKCLKMNDKIIENEMGC